MQFRGPGPRPGRDPGEGSKALPTPQWGQWGQFDWDKVPMAAFLQQVHVDSQNLTSCINRCLFLRQNIERTTKGPVVARPGQHNRTAIQGFCTHGTTATAVCISSRHQPPRRTAHRGLILGCRTSQNPSVPHLQRLAIPVDRIGQRSVGYEATWAFASPFSVCA